MSQLRTRYPWWNLADTYIRRCANNLSELERLKTKGEAQDAETEARIMELSRATHAVSKAILRTSTRENGYTRLEVVAQVYWRNKSLEQAAESVFYSVPQVKRFTGEFMLEIAQGMGWNTDKKMIL